jgi:hypothetical protein
MLYWNDGLPGYNVNVSDDQQLDFRSLGEFYIVIFLNKLKIVENTPKNEKIKISQAPSWLFVSRIDVPAEPLSHRPCPQVDT